MEGPTPALDIREIEEIEETFLHALEQACFLPSPRTENAVAIEIDVLETGPIYCPSRRFVRRNGPHR